MIKKISILTILLLSCVINSFAIKQHTITFNEEQEKLKTINVANFKIFVELTDVDSNDNATIKIEIENDDDSKGLLLFDEEYDEKTLKKRRPEKIKYDKFFPGKETTRKVDSYKNITKTIHIEPSYRELITTISIDEDDSKKITLPIYIIEPKEKNYIFWKREEWILKAKEDIELNIEIDLKPSEHYVKIKEECDNILKEFDTLLFCTNKKHEPSLEEQKAEFQGKIDSLIEKITNFIKNKWSSDKEYKLYVDQINRLKNIKLEEKEGDCGKHKAPPHRCKYCNSSLEDIYKKLDDIYQTIHGSEDRRATKAKYIRSVNAMYDCAKRRRDWRNSKCKDDIIEQYNGIINKF